MRDELDLAQLSCSNDAQSQALTDAVADEQPLQVGDVRDGDAVGADDQILGAQACPVSRTAVR